MSIDRERRAFLRNSAQITAIAVGTLSAIPHEAFAITRKPAETKNAEPEVTATEDLMREHGIIRRALVIYSETVSKLRSDAAGVDSGALRDTANLFRTFGENYHEKMLEEAHIFPVVRKSGGELARYTDILEAQHARGREITDYILAVTAGAKIGATHAEPLARVFESFVRMYTSHAAREDTIVFPAWKKHYSNKQLDGKSDEFEEIEHRMFGKDGFEDAEKRISAIESRLGLADLARFTPPPPPKA